MVNEVEPEGVYSVDIVFAKLSSGAYIIASAGKDNGRTEAPGPHNLLFDGVGRGPYCFPFVLPAAVPVFNRNAYTPLHARRVLRYTERYAIVFELP